jgi:hypothetical protein
VEGAVEAPSDRLALLPLLAHPASLARLRLGPRRSLTARLMFRGRRGRRLIGPRLGLAATALSAQTWRARLVSRGHGALLLSWRGGPLRRGRGTVLLARHRTLLGQRWRHRPLGRRLRAQGRRYFRWT